MDFGHRMRCMSIVASELEECDGFVRGASRAKTGNVIT